MCANEKSTSFSLKAAFSLLAFRSLRLARISRSARRTLASIRVRGYLKRATKFLRYILRGVGVYFPRGQTMVSTPTCKNIV